jgi:hypothetical protein
MMNICSNAHVLSPLSQAFKVRARNKGVWYRALEGIAGAI